MKKLSGQNCEKNLALWESIAHTINYVQSMLFDHKNDNRYDNQDVFRLILEADPNTAFGLSKEDFFILRRPYGDEQLGLVVDKGELKEPPLLLWNDSLNHADYKQSVLFQTNEILSGNHKKNTGQEYLLLNDFAATQLDHFVQEYRSLLIVPMRLYKNKFTGVFIFGDRHTNAFDKRLANALDMASDRVSSLLRASDENLRGLMVKEYQFQAMAKGRFDNEQAVIEMAVKYLTNSLGQLGGRIPFETQPWFRPHEVNIIIRNPMNPSAFYWACKAGSVTDGNPMLNVVSEDDFSALAGELSRNTQGVYTPILLQEVHATGEPIAKNSQSECAEFLGEHTLLKSWIAAPMQISSQGIIGYFILHNKIEQQAYASEAGLLDQFSDFTASMIRGVRRQRREAALNDFRQVFKNKQHANGTIEDFIKRCMDCLVSVYGDNISMRIVLRNRLSGDYEVKASSITSKTLDPLGDALAEKIHEFVLHPNSSPQEISLKTVAGAEHYVLIPLKRMTPTDFSIAKEGGPDYINIGCLVIEGHQVGASDRQYIDEVTNLLALKVHQTEEQTRQAAFDAFNHDISALPYEMLTEQKLLGLVKDITSEVMFSDNLYVALLEQSTNAIRFPLLMKGGKHNTAAQQKAESNRCLDVHAPKKGRTESILTNREPIFIESREASIKWYEEDSHEELLGDPFASWIGVPIISNNQVLGVIAAYHETKDFLYNRQSVKFLERVAAAVVPLLVLQRLNESIKNNTELRKAHKEIAKKEAQLASSLVSQDLTHRLNNSLGSISINIEQSMRDVNKAVEVKDVQYLQYTPSTLEDVSLVVNELIEDVSDITSSKESEFIVNDLIIRLLQQVHVELRLEQYNIKVVNNNSNKQLKLKMVYRFVSNCLHSLIFNAGKALTERAKQEGNTDKLYLQVDVSLASGFVYIDVTDNGVPIPDKIRPVIFEYGISSQRDQEGHGYGLWRAQSLMRSYGGDVQLVETQDETKLFRLIAKHEFTPDKLIAYVIDDERSWRNILTRWLQDMGYDVKTAADYKEAESLIGREDLSPALLLLDVALDNKDGANVEGLKLIDKVRMSHSEAKIALVSGYLEKAHKYTNEVDIILDKIGDKGALTFNTLKKALIS